MAGKVDFDRKVVSCVCGKWHVRMDQGKCPVYRAQNIPWSETAAGRLHGAEMALDRAIMMDDSEAFDHWVSEVARWTPHA